jgi:hypothetical protein
MSENKGEFREEPLFLFFQTMVEKWGVRSAIDYYQRTSENRVPTKITLPNAHAAMPRIPRS